MGNITKKIKTLLLIIYQPQNKFLYSVDYVDWTECFTELFWKIEVTHNQTSRFGAQRQIFKESKGLANSM